MQIKAENTGTFVGLINIVADALANCPPNTTYLIDGTHLCQGAYCNPLCSQLGLDCKTKDSCVPRCYCTSGYAESNHKCIAVEECTDPIQVEPEHLPRLGDFLPQ